MSATPFQPATNLWRALEIDVLRKALAELCGDSRTILDLGCGDGEIMRLIRPSLSKEVAVTGIDSDPAEVALAQKSGVYARTLCTAAQNLPLEDCSFEAVISNSVLEHIEPINQTLDEVARILKSGGLFFATVPAPDFHDCLRGPWLFGTRESYLAALDARLAHVRYWNDAQWEAKLAARGIDMLRATPYLDRRATQRWESLSNMTGRLLYALSGGRKRPIALQRQLGLRGNVRMPLFLARSAARMVALWLGAGDNLPQACLLIVGRKR
jgi:SAM-dependent methyltransferase